MIETDDGTCRTRPPRLSRRALLSALALAPALPWLAQAARAEDEAPALTAARTGSRTPLPRQQHTATPLGGGYVLVAGGLAGSALADVEILCPDGTLRAAARLNTPRFGHAAVALGGGRVAVLGGYAQGPLASVEWYDPARNTWTALAPLDRPRYQHAAALVSDGAILLTGGCFQGLLSDTELYTL